MHATYNTLLSF